MLDNMRLSLVLLAGTTLASRERSKQAVEEHGSIVAAIGTRDPDRAEQAARTHISNSFKQRIRLIRRLPEPVTTVYLGVRGLDRLRSRGGMP